MAGDWIKMRSDLYDDPAVFGIAAATQLDRFAVVGRLHAFWSWCDRHAVDGRVDGGASPLVDTIVAHEGFAEALQKVGWLAVGDGFVEIPHFDRHNSESAKQRGQKNARQARWRRSRDGGVDAHTSTCASTCASTREEKRRDTVTNVTDGAAVDPVKVAFDTGVRLLSPTEGEVRARSIVGKLRKVLGDGKVTELLNEAATRTDAVPWLMKAHASAEVMDRISKANGGAEVRRLRGGRFQCGPRYYSPEGREELGIA